MIQGRRLDRTQPHWQGVGKGPRNRHTRRRPGKNRHVRFFTQITLDIGHCSRSRILYVVNQVSRYKLRGQGTHNNSSRAPSS